MLPLTYYSRTDGPFKNGSGNTVFLRMIEGFRQPPPYNVVTYYRTDVWKTLAGDVNASSWSFGPPPDSMPPALERAYIAAKNRAYEKWVGRAKSDAASFGATLTAERRDTWAMFVTAVTRALSAAKAVKAMQFGRAASILGIPYKETTKRKRVGFRTEIRYDKRMRRTRPVRVPVFQKKTYMQFGSRREMLKSIAGGWLMWSYGVKPLAQDCYAAMEILTAQTEQSRVRASAKAEGVFYQVKDPDGTEMKWSGRFGIVCKGTIEIENHDLYLIAQLGLTNPAQWLLEGIPFSFVVDWFSNLSTVVNSMSELGGLKITDASTSERFELGDRYYIAWPPQAAGLKYDRSRFTQRRILGLIGPELQFAWERFSWQRGANAISLLVGFLPRR